MNAVSTDTIAAIATPPGRGGIGIVRISGAKAAAIAQRVLGVQPTPRRAHFGPFYETTSAGPQALDEGIALFFPGPHSFTGEDVLELQGHGGPIVLDCLLRELLHLGARLARPGEFSERAFLNDKIDLAQAEAIADLIDSASEQAARGALRSLQGEFSQRIRTLIEQLTRLRIYVEAAIDFPEEEIDFLADGRVAQDLAAILVALDSVCASAVQGSILREGLTVVIAGAPNAGKSSLLNALAERDSAIVTAIAGTTRDVLREQILLDGMPLHIIDTAGLRESEDEVEREGIRRAWLEIEKADLILLVVDASTQTLNEPTQLWPTLVPIALGRQQVTVVRNKCDLLALPAQLENQGATTVVTLSAKTGIGIDLLRDHLKNCAGYQGAGEGGFLARRRHVDALDRARNHLLRGHLQLTEHGAGELLAEDLRQCQQTLGEITGQLSSDDLLGRIFSSFCVGK
jgi:tRNA modification GTPase